MLPVNATDYTDPIPMPDGFVVPPNGNHVRQYESVLAHLLAWDNNSFGLAILHPYIKYLLLVSYPLNVCLNCLLAVRKC